MRTFKHTGKGYYMGSICIVVAKSKKVAERLIRAELDAAGLAKEKLDVVEVKTEKPMIIYFDNGDY